MFVKDIHYPSPKNVGTGEINLARNIVLILHGGGDVDAQFLHPRFGEHAPSDHHVVVVVCDGVHIAEEHGVGYPASFVVVVEELGNVPVQLLASRHIQFAPLHNVATGESLHTKDAPSDLGEGKVGSEPNLRRMHPFRDSLYLPLDFHLPTDDALLLEGNDGLVIYKLNNKGFTFTQKGTFQLYQIDGKTGISVLPNTFTASRLDSLYYIDNGGNSTLVAIKTTFNKTTVDGREIVKELVEDKLI